MNDAKKDIYFQATLDASSTKIWNELKTMKESSPHKKEKARRRWIWELIQNASDCTPDGGKIDITLELSNNQVTFEHNGVPFSYENLFSLITQISTKQRAEGKKTGKFGTGFMSTHLLSEVVKVEGAFIRSDGEYTSLEFFIDRSSKDPLDIMEKIQTMLEELEALNDTQNQLEEYSKTTKFIYNIDHAEIKASVKQGINDLIETLPYVLTFNENIRSIICNGVIYKRGEDIFSKKQPKLKVIDIKSSNGNEQRLLCLKENDITIACPIKTDNNQIYFLPISNRIPKLFCEFPLIGTEKNSFPIILNSEKFDVEIDRDAIRDDNPTNRKLIDEAVSLYKEFIDYCVEKENINDTFNVCILNYHDEYLLQKICYQEIRKYIQKKEIIPISHTSKVRKRKAFKDDSGVDQVIIPVTREESNDDSFWELLSSINAWDLPTKDSSGGWRKVFSSNFNFYKLNDELKEVNISKLNEFFNEKDQTLEWINKFYNLWIQDEGLEKVIKFVFVPTQQGEFIEIKEVYFDDNIHEGLKEILTLLGISIKKNLLSREITAFNEYFDDHHDKKRNTEKISRSIEAEVSKILYNESLNQAERPKSIQDIFNKLTDFFLQEPEITKELFPNLYSKRMMLSTTEENLRRLRIAEKVEENGITYEELGDLIESHKSIRDIINNPELSEDEIRRLLNHVVTSTKDMKEYFDLILIRSIENVYDYLKSSKHYTLPQTLEEWKEQKYSETVFSAVKDGKEKRIIIRPSDSQQIIFYYDEEYEALDDTEYELWTDDGERQQIVTLGDLLKTTGITRIPLRKLINT